MKQSHPVAERLRLKRVSFLKLGVHPPVRLRASSCRSTLAISTAGILPNNRTELTNQVTPSPRMSHRVVMLIPDTLLDVMYRARTFPNKSYTVFDAD